MSSKLRNVPNILNGKLFKILPSSITENDNVKAKCLTCKQIIAGYLNEASSFELHVQREHPKLSETFRDLFRPQPRKWSFNRLLDGKYFTYVRHLGNGKIMTQCQLCKKHILGNIRHKNNLFAHIKTKHGAHLEELQKHCALKWDEVDEWNFEKFIADANGQRAKGESSTTIGESARNGSDNATNGESLLMKLY